MRRLVAVQDLFVPGCLASPFGAAPESLHLSLAWVKLVQNLRLLERRTQTSMMPHVGSRGCSVLEVDRTPEAPRLLPGDVETVIRQDAPQALYRNPFLADAMVELNLIDSQGGGIKRMFETQR